MRYIPGKEAARPAQAMESDDDEYYDKPRFQRRSVSPEHQFEHDDECAETPQFAAPIPQRPAAAHQPEAAGYNSDDERGSRGATYANELEFVHALWRKKRWQVIKMREDGACLFRSVAYHVYGDQEMHGQVRRLCMDYMERNRDHFEGFITEDFATYIERKRHDREHGNHVEIQAMSEMFSRCVEVYHYSDEPLNIFQAHCNTEAPVRLLYHGNHYDAIIDPSRPSFGVGLGFSDLRPGEADTRLMQAAEEASVNEALVDSFLKDHDFERTQAEMEAAVLQLSRADAGPGPGDDADLDDVLRLSREEFERAQFAAFAAQAGAAGRSAAP